MLVECDLWVCVSVACWCWCVCVSQFDLVFYNFIQISLFLYFFFFFFWLHFLTVISFLVVLFILFFLRLCSSKNTKSALVRFFVLVDKLMHYIYIYLGIYIFWLSIAQRSDLDPSLVLFDGEFVVSFILLYRIRID